MKKRYFISFVCVFYTLAMLLSSTAFAVAKIGRGPTSLAYSSCLPIILGGTLFIEIAIIVLFTDIKTTGRIALAVVLANLASFIIMRIPLGLRRHGLVFVGPLMYNTRPINWLILCCAYVVSMGFEILFAWIFLREHTKNIRWLISIVAITKTLTFTATTIIEIVLISS